MDRSHFLKTTLGISFFITSTLAMAAIPQNQSLTDIGEVVKAIRQDEAQPQAKTPVPQKVIPPSPKKSEVKAPPQKSTYRPPARPAHFTSVDAKPAFDIPVTYNNKVKKWINYFQNNGKKWFGTWLSRSHRYLPLMKETLAQRGLPQDLAYIAMIESGFSAHAASHAQAVGYWQFIESTANRYGLATDWWIDERRDFKKSTQAAASYLGDLYRMFDSWYLTAAAYNMGENRLKRLSAKHQTKNFWLLAEKSDFPKETREYIPKMIAAMLIAKAPALYGFRDVKPLSPHQFEYFYVPGGTDLYNLATYLKIDGENLKKLNPELVKGFIPKFVENHRIRIPKGLTPRVSQFVRLQLTQN